MILKIGDAVRFLNCGHWLKGVVVKCACDHTVIRGDKHGWEYVVVNYTDIRKLK